MSRLPRPSPVTCSPLPASRPVRSRPSIPFAPVISQPVIAEFLACWSNVQAECRARWSGADLDLAVVAEDEAVCPGYARGGGHLRVMADDRRLDPANALDGGPAQHDRVLDFAVVNHALLRDRGKRADVAADHLGASPDDRRADDA